MKEFDYSKWDNKPREMWVWVNENHKEKKLVVFINSYTNSPSKVLAVSENVESLTWWRHCAEIEQTRRMTNYELSHWLWEGTQVGEFREWHNVGVNINYSTFDYPTNSNDELLPNNIEIRVNGGEWKEPLIDE